MHATGLKSIQQLPLKPLRDMRILEGDLNTLLEQGRTDPNNKDYLLVRLTDQSAILDPMGKLRQVYENVLHTEKTWLQDSSNLQVNSTKLKRGELEMFTDFFEQVSGIPLTEEQDAAIKAIITTIHAHEGGLL